MLNKTLLGVFCVGLALSSFATTDPRCADDKLRPYANLRECDFRATNFQDVAVTRKGGKVDLTGANLFKADFTKNKTLKGSVIFTGADLNFAKLDQINAERVSFYKAKLNYISLRGAKLENAVFTEANLSNAHLEKSNLSNASLHKAIMIEVELDGATANNINLTGANLSGTKLRGTKLKGAQLQGADLTGAQMNSKTDLTHADLTDATLNRINAINVNFAVARSLVGAKFVATKIAEPLILDKANFKNQNLTSTTFTVVRAQNADFSGATLNNAVIMFSNFHSSNFNRASMVGVSLNEVAAVNANFSRADFKNSTLGVINFSQANLTRADLSNTQISCLVDFRNAIWVNGRKCAYNSPFGSCPTYFYNSKCGK